MDALCLLKQVTVEQKPGTYLRPHASMYMHRYMHRERQIAKKTDWQTQTHTHTHIHTCTTIYLYATLNSCRGTWIQIDTCIFEMLSTKSILPAVDLRSCRLKRICALVPLYQLVKLFRLACTLCFYFCCPPAGASVVLWSSCVSTSFAFLVVTTSPNTNLLQGVAASEPEFGTDAGKVDGYRNCSARSSSRRNSGVNSSSSRRSSRGGISSTAAEGKNTQKQRAGKLLMAKTGDVSSSGTEAVKRRVHSQKKTSDEERRQTRLEKDDDERRKRDRMIKEMQELLSENASWRKLQARRQAEKELGKYADEEGQLQVERFDAWKEAYSKYKKQRKQASILQMGAAASGGLGTAGLLGLFSKWPPKGVQKPEEAKAHRRLIWTMSAAGVAGLVGTVVSLLGRRHIKKMQRLSERRLTRMENEAYAGVVPRLQPTLGVDESPEEERRRDEEKRRQQRQKR